MAENRVPLTTMRLVWDFLVKLYPGFASVEEIRKNLRAEIRKLPEQRRNKLQEEGICEDQLASEVISVLKELERLELIFPRKSKFRRGGYSKAAACYNRETFKKEAVKATKLVTGNHSNHLDSVREQIDSDKEYLTSVMGYFQGKANSFASLFIAVLIGLYALIAMIPALRAGELHVSFLATGLPFVLACLFGSGMLLLGLFACLIALLYHKYTRLADEVNNAMYRDVQSRIDFLQHTAVLDGRGIGRAGYACVVAILFVTLLITLVLLFS